MKIRLSTLMVLLIATLSTFGQHLPRIVLIENDTNIIISTEQLRFVNRQIATVDYLKKKNISLQKVVDAYKNNLTLQIKYTFQIEKENSILQTINTTKDKQLRTLQKKADAEKKQARKGNRRAIITSLGIGFIAGIITSIFI